MKEMLIFQKEVITLKTIGIKGVISVFKIIKHDVASTKKYRKRKKKRVIGNSQKEAKDQLVNSS